MEFSVAQQSFKSYLDKVQMIIQENESYLNKDIAMNLLNEFRKLLNGVFAITGLLELA